MGTAPSGISVDALQSELNLDSRKIITLLRYLSACGWGSYITDTSKPNENRRSSSSMVHAP
ncbi:hypothetical protein AZE42_14050 [Rhizopogon vesiculosus]|uniref:Uncharacterized protein n=1 Tax=Rhizopogon vesiculosus TaxID=180088 RepID=A0A1J8PVD6_9AGAM|nr:hypothetical protein AZE42_14050 [Rhizopogon vesiculosus]